MRRPGRRLRLRLRTAGAALACLLVAGGCASGPKPARAAAETAGAASVQTSIVGTSGQGRPIELIQVGDGPARILVIATIHGDEAAGTPMMPRLVSALLADPWRFARRTVLIMPETNPDGRAAGRRGNAAGADLNRDFPADNRAPGRPAGLQHPESRAIAGVVRAWSPHLIVSVHQPLDCVDWDGPEPAATIAARMAAASDLPARKLGSRNGSLGAWAGETLGIPTITVELPRDAGRDEAADWRRYRAMFLVAVQSVTDAARPGQS